MWSLELRSSGWIALVGTWGFCAEQSKVDICGSATDKRRNTRSYQSNSEGTLMMDSSASAQRTRSRLRSHWRLATLICSGFVAVILISCATVTRTVVAPPEIQGAEFVGSKTCAECHENISRDFPTATHA